MTEEYVRSMARVVKVDEVRPIENADAIEQCVIGGWLVVAKKDDYKVGDLAIYMEPDSWVPTELAPFLSKEKEPRVYNDVRGEKLRTIRLRGAISQGLLLPLSVIDFPVVEGQDLTELLNIQKWEAPIPACLAGMVKGSWPAGIPKTDEPRCQNLRKEWETEQHRYVWEVTEKLEGSSMTVGLVDDDFIVCSRNLNLKETEGNTFWQVARALDIEAKMRNHGMNNIVFQGELVGPGLNGDIYKLAKHDFYVYNIFDKMLDEYLEPEERRELVKLLGLKSVPLLHERLATEGWSIDDLLKYATAPSALRESQLREGIVFKRIGGPEHLKAISNEYLAKKKG